MDRVAEREMEGASITGCEEVAAFAVEFNIRFAGFFAVHFNVEPAEPFSDTGAECFGDCFLGGEASSDEGAGIFVGEAILDLGGKQDSADETFAEFFVGGANSGDLDDVGSNAEDHACAG